MLIRMETSARMKEHHIDGTSSLQVSKGDLHYSVRGQAYDLPTGSLWLGIKRRRISLHVQRLLQSCVTYGLAVLNPFGKTYRGTMNRTVEKCLLV